MLSSLDRDNVSAWLDALGLGVGPVRVAPVGAGQSNPTYLVSRGDDRWVLRRPPVGPLVPGTHDVLREASWMRGLSANGVAVPEIVALSDPTTNQPGLGFAAVLMEFVEGFVPESGLPAQHDQPETRRALGLSFVDSLAALHAVDASASEFEQFRRPGNFVDRQLARFAKLWPVNQTREIPELLAVQRWLERERPRLNHDDVTVVHGDARPGNAMFAMTGTGPEVRALLDWELAAIGDPMTDVGYLLATWTEADDLANPDPLHEVSRWTSTEGFPSRAELGGHYATASNRSVDQVAYYEVLALWKATIIMEGNYARYLAAPDGMAPMIATYGEGLPALAQRALRVAETCGTVA